MTQTPSGPATSSNAPLSTLLATPEPGSLIVTIAGDIVDAFDGETSLREAIAFANGQIGADTVTFSSDFDGGAEDLIRLTVGELHIVDAVTVDGGAQGVTITGDAAGNDITVAGTDITDAQSSAAADLLRDNSRVFLIDADATLKGLTITGGFAGPDGPWDANDPSLFQDREGGGVYVRTGNVSVEQSAIAGNTAAAFDFFRAEGGGIAVEQSRLSVIDTDVSGNQVISIDWATGAPSDVGLEVGRGGGISSNTSDPANALEIVGSTISGNYVDSRIGLGEGGGVYARYVTVDDTLINDNTLIVANGGSGTRWGGGGLRADIEAQISNSRFIDNTLTTANGSTSIFAGGGGFRADSGFLVNSEVSGNTSTGPGGGIQVADDSIDGSPFLIENSTIANNSTISWGGAVDGDDLLVVNSTITGNAANVTTGGILGSDVTLTDSLVLGNSGPGPQVAVTSFGSLVQNGGNIIDDTRTVDGVAVETVSASDVFDQVLDNNGVYAGVLANNGGWMQTVLIALGGAAQDNGSNATATDQRGEARPFGPASDLGAVELQEAPPVSPANSHIEFDSAKLALAAGGKPNLVQVSLHTGDLNGVDNVEYDNNGTKTVDDDQFGGIDDGGTLLASELYRRGGGGRFEDENYEAGDLAAGVQDIGGWKTLEGEKLNPLLDDIIAIDAFKIRKDATTAPDSFLFAGDDADGFSPDGAQTVLKGDQGLRAQSKGFGLEFGIDRNGAGKPDFAGDGGPTKGIAGPELLLFTLAEGLVGTGVSFGVDRTEGGSANVTVDFFELDRLSGLYERVGTEAVMEVEDGLPTGPGNALAALDFSFDAVAFSSADGDRFRLEQLEIGTFTDVFLGV